MPASWRMDIDIARTGGAQFTLLMRDVNGNPVDVTGVDVDIEILKASGDTVPILTAGLEDDDDVTGAMLTDASGGQVLMTYHGADLAALDGRYETIRLSHKIRFTRAGDVALLVFGQINLLPE